MEEYYRMQREYEARNSAEYWSNFERDFLYNFNIQLQNEYESGIKLEQARQRLMEAQGNAYSQEYEDSIDKELEYMEWVISTAYSELDKTEKQIRLIERRKELESGYYAID